MLKRFAKYFKPHLGLFILDLTCAFFVGMADQFMPLAVRRMMNIYIPDRNYRMMIYWCIALAVIYLVKLGLNLIINYYGHVCGVLIQADMRKELFEHIEKLPTSYFDTHKTGTIMSRIVNDLQEISEMAHHGPENIFIITVMLVVSAIMLGRIDVKLTIIVFLALPIAITFATLIRKGQLEAFTNNRKKIAEVNANVETSIAGVRVAKAFTAMDEEYDKFDDANRDYIDARKNSYKYLALFSSGMNFFTDMMYLVVIIFGGYFFMKNEINGGDFVAFLLYISTFLTPIKKFVETYEQIAEGMSGFERYCEIMDIREEVDNAGAVSIEHLEGDIVFDNVGFRYGNSKESKVFDNLSMHLEKGKTTALVGPSGGGKSTICKLIPRFYELEEGNIYIDGHDITTLTRESLRKNIGVVDQDVFLFIGSIKDNIAYGHPNATMEEVIAAAKKAEIHDYIMTLPNGYDTEVGERGIRLSGGQRQRISIARVFLKNPPILILDEATSALDNATEMQIQSALDELAKGRTVLVVAHRLSTIRNADQIIYINDTGIVEAGGQEELLAHNGAFKKLYDAQYNQLEVMHG